MSKPVEEMPLDCLLWNLAQLGDNNGAEFFEKTIGTKARLRQFVASLRSNKASIIESQQTSDSNRDLVLEKFEELPEDPSGPEAWNSWKEHVESCVDQYGPSVTLITSDDSIIIMGQGFVQQINGTEALEEIRQDIEMGQNPPKFDFSGQDIARHYYLPGINLSRTNLIGTRLDGLDLTNAMMRNSSYGFSNLRGTVLKNADMQNAMIFCAEVGRAEFERTNFTNSLILGTDFKDGQLPRAIFEDVMMPGAKFRNANLQRADFTNAYLKYGDFRGADLRGATLVDTDLSSADISGSKVYGASVWNVNLNRAIQRDIVITKDGEPTITIDNLKVAQFVYLLLNNAEIRDAIDTLGNKAVLILGRFTDERKAVLDTIKSELRRRNYVPIIFDFTKPSSRDLTETVMTLASISRFVIADLSDPNSIPHELMSFTEKLLSVPVQPIFCPVPAHKTPYPMFEHLSRYSHVLPIYEYGNREELVPVLAEKVIKPVEAKATEMRPKG